MMYEQKCLKVEEAQEEVSNELGELKKELNKK